MQEQLVEFETAVLAKEGGFDWKCFNYFYTDKYKKQLGQRLCSETSLYPITNSRRNDELIECVAPTQSLLAKWLREVHNIHVQAHPIIGFRWGFSTYRTDKSLLYAQGTGYVGNKFYGKIYEEAVEKGLQKALTLIKEKL
jgi:hypothetical protein